MLVNVPSLCLYFLVNVHVHNISYHVCFYVPWLGDFEHHLKMYLLEIILLCILGDVQVGHLPTPDKPTPSWIDGFCYIMDDAPLKNGESLGMMVAPFCYALPTL
jgi:hypothetical protein